jgi:hypothetical protein
MSPQGSYAPGIAKTVVVESDKTARVDVDARYGDVDGVRLQAAAGHTHSTNSGPTTLDDF